MMKKVAAFLLSLTMLLTLTGTALAADSPIIRAGETLTVSLEAGKNTDVTFAPEVSGLYRLTSDAAEPLDPAVTVYAGGEVYADADDTADSANFALQFYGDADVTYTLRLSETAGAAATYSITMEPADTVKNVAFSPACGGYVYYENTYVYPALAAGDAVTVTLESGKTCRYVYQTALADFYCSQTKTYISADFGSVPELKPMFDEADGSFLYSAEFRFLGTGHMIDVERSQNPVKAIAYKPVKPIRVAENTNGEETTDSEGNTYFLYHFSVNAGDALTVNYVNGTQDTFTLKDTEKDGLRFVNEEGKTPEEAYFYIDYQACQEQTHWQPGTNYFTVHYFGSECRVPVSVVKPGWFKDGGKWYYFDTAGNAATGWKKLGGKWYLFKYADGSMLTGWVKSGGKWYFFNASGAMLTGWQKISGKWYFFNSSGAMLTGWVKSGGKWYFFNASGAMLTGWVKSGGKWYYFESSGAMAAKKSLRIGGKTYQFNASGVCINP